MVEATKTKCDAAWNNWISFLNNTGMPNSYFLENFSSFQRNIIVCAFAQAVREASFSRGDRKDLVEGTVSATVSYVAQTFRENDRKDPRLDADGKTCFLFYKQCRGYCNADGVVKKQKALPLGVLRKMVNLAKSNLDSAIAWLLVGAIFFAMLSCEYLETGIKEDQRRTKILRVKNFLFKARGKAVPLTSKNLATADMVMITFESQKNDWQSKSVHMFKTKDKVLCPVKAWARVIQRLMATIDDFSVDTVVCAYKSNNTVIHLTGDLVRSKLQTIVELMGEDTLGFSKDDIGLHSIRAGGAMAMFLSGVCEIIIQRVGRWSSFAFLEYIREQVDCFTAGVSTKMLEHEDFYHLNEEQSLKILQNTQLNPQGGDGPEDVPFNIRFSNMVLNKL